ncbi:MAG TPA: hypothetical protein VLF63_03115 [Patescibacteria group bacterium]|nr:hypothetical protein [Patescibacteria group bacterium]
MEKYLYDQEELYWVWHCLEEECGDQFMRLVECTPLSEDFSLYQATFQCPNCECKFEGEFPAEIIYYQQEELQGDVEDLVDTFIKVKRQHMEEYAPKFISALENDLILPEDF